MIPKAELHVHLEGTATPDLVRRLAKRHEMALPSKMFGPDGDFIWCGFLDFLDLYDAAAAVIRTPEDYRDVTLDYLRRSAAEGAIYVEMMSSPDHAAQNGMSYSDHLEGIAAGIEEAREECGIEGRIIVTCVRHFGAEGGLEIAQQVVAQPHPLVVGFGMGGDKTINEISEITTAIASAVEEQGAATGDISRNVQEAAVGTQSVSESIVKVRGASEETGQASGQVVGAAKELAEKFGQLKGEVETFLTDIKAA